MHLTRCLGRWALLLIGSAFPAPSLVAQTPHRDINPTPEVVSVVFAGATKAIELPELQASIYTEPSRCRTLVLTPLCKFTNYRGFEERHYLNRQEFKRDVLRIRVFYFREGYREAQVDTAVTQVNDDQVAVRFTIVEGPPTIVTDVQIVADSTLLSAKKIRQLNQVLVGKPLDLFELDSTRIQFQNELWEQGYADALVDTSSVVDAEHHTAQVQVRIIANRLATVGEIAIVGTEQVGEKTVLNSLSFRSGDLYKRSAVLESQRNLYESNLFKMAALDVPTTFDSVKAVAVVVREAPVHEARIGGGFNSVDFLQAEGRFTHYNLFGGARRLDVSATVGNLGASSLNGTRPFRSVSQDTSITGDAGVFLQPNYQTSIELKQAAFLQQPKNALSVGAFAQRRSVPAVVIDRGFGGNLTYTRTLTLRAPASLSYRYELTRVEAGGPYFCVNFGVCDTTAIGALRSHQSLSPLLLQGQIDRSDQPLSPMRGYTARVELEHASRVTASDYRYNRAYAEGTLYARMGAKTGVLASHLRIGFARPAAGGGPTGAAVLHPRKRFYAGGSQSVRGYGENQLGPRILTLPRAYLLHSKTADGLPCDASSDAIRLCDPNFITDSATAEKVGDDKFTARPTGGTSLIEASVEYRFPLPFLKDLGGAVFLDGAAVGERVLDPLGVNPQQTLAALVHGTGAITPGFGIRYYSSVGPIRIDVGFNPSREEELAVVTELSRNGKAEIIALKTPKRLSAVGTATGIGAILNRFTLHLSIGQAY
ncbi:MAG: BamA/TamA family outer membrane protein [Gemmatimonadota bacterium]